MMLNEAQAQATAASGRGDGRYPSGLHDGAEIMHGGGGGGYGSGEVLRPGGSQTPDDASGQNDKGQAGMPQGGPLSPLLSNILLDELDKELERRGHSFCRYVDDCNIYVSSRKAGDHQLKDIRAFVENKLKVNEKKSAVARPWERRFLGYSVTWHKQAKLKIALTSVKRLKEKVRSLTTGNRSKSVKATINALTPVLRGWISYFRLTEVRGMLEEPHVRWCERTAGVIPPPTRLTVPISMRKLKEILRIK